MNVSYVINSKLQSHQFTSFRLDLDVQNATFLVLTKVHLLHSIILRRKIISMTRYELLQYTVHKS